jgi:pimeloyl-ACP methyl ester carboxylesterase
MGEHVRAGDLDIWTEQVGGGSDVLLIGGAGDTVESWQFQLDGLADRYRLSAFDNRGAGRTAIPGATLKIYPKTGHAVHWERPDRSCGIWSRTCTKHVLAISPS